MTIKLLLTLKNRSLLFVIVYLLPCVVNCAEVKVMTSGAFEIALTELAPRFERASHNKISVIAKSMGIGPNYIPNRVRGGEPVDIVILPDQALQELIKEGRIAEGTNILLAKSKIGMAVRSGAPKPDISSVDALKQALLRARSIGYSAQASGQYLATELFPRLGISAQIADKLKRVDQGRVGTVVARGEAEIGFQQISELLPITGIDYVGPLPAEVQRTTLFSAAVVATSQDVATARTFVHFLASQGAAATIAKSGLEPAATAR